MFCETSSPTCRVSVIKYEFFWTHCHLLAHFPRETAASGMQNSNVEHCEWVTQISSCIKCLSRSFCLCFGTQVLIGLEQCFNLHRCTAKFTHGGPRCCRCPVLFLLQISRLSNFHRDASQITGAYLGSQLDLLMSFKATSFCGV